MAVRNWERIKLSADVKNHFFIATNGKIDLFAPAGDLDQTLRKPEPCLDILIAA